MPFPFARRDEDIQAFNKNQTNCLKFDLSPATLSLGEENIDSAEGVMAIPRVCGQVVVCNESGSRPVREFAHDEVLIVNGNCRTLCVDGVNYIAVPMDGSNKNIDFVAGQLKIGVIKAHSDRSKAEMTPAPSRRATTSESPNQTPDGNRREGSAETET